MQYLTGFYVFKQWFCLRWIRQVKEMHFAHEVEDSSFFDSPHFCRVYFSFFLSFEEICLSCNKILGLMLERSLHFLRVKLSAILVLWCSVPRLHSTSSNLQMYKRSQQERMKYCLSVFSTYGKEKDYMAAGEN